MSPPSRLAASRCPSDIRIGWVRLPYDLETVKTPHQGCLYCLEQDTGVEPAFTAWEAVVLPIYESCVGVGIIADTNGKFNTFLSRALAGPAFYRLWGNGGNSCLRPRGWPLFFIFYKIWVEITAHLWYDIVVSIWAYCALFAQLHPPIPVFSQARSA